MTCMLCVYRAVNPIYGVCSSSSGVLISCVWHMALTCCTPLRFPAACCNLEAAAIRTAQRLRAKSKVQMSSCTVHGPARYTAARAAPIEAPPTAAYCMLPASLPTLEQGGSLRTPHKVPSYCCWDPGALRPVRPTPQRGVQCDAGHMVSTRPEASRNNGSAAALSLSLMRSDCQSPFCSRKQSSLSPSSMPRSPGVW